MAVIKQRVTSEVIDNETGAITRREEDTTLSFPSEPPYVKFYLHDILYLSDLPKTHDKILLSLLKRATWANADYGMIFTLSAGLKRMMAKELGFKNSRTINNALSDFVKADIFKRLETGVYQLNPYLFGRGNWQDIEKLRMEIDYTLKGRTFKSMIEYKNSLANSPESHTSHEELPTQEKVPAEVETPENKPVGENFEILLKTDLPQLIGTEKQIWWAEQIRLNFFNELNFENMTKKLVEIFKTKTESKFWIENREKEIDELEKTL